MNTEAGTMPLSNNASYVNKLKMLEKISSIKKLKPKPKNMKGGLLTGELTPFSEWNNKLNSPNSQNLSHS